MIFKPQLGTRRRLRSAAENQQRSETIRGTALLKNLFLTQQRMCVGFKKKTSGLNLWNILQSHRTRPAELQMTVGGEKKKKELGLCV